MTSLERLREGGIMRRKVCVGELQFERQFEDVFPGQVPTYKYVFIVGVKKFF